MPDNCGAWTYLSRENDPMDYDMVRGDGDKEPVPVTTYPLILKEENAMEFDSIWKPYSGDLRPYTGVKINVIGIGGAGRNAVRRMIEKNMNVEDDMVELRWRKGIIGASFFEADTDSQDLLSCPGVNSLVILGKDITKGHCTGGDPGLGEKAAEATSESIKLVLDEADVVVLICGMGGGTGAGAAPVIGRIAKEMGKLTVGIVTMPFSSEKSGMDKALSGIERLKENIDTLIVIPADRLFESKNGSTPADDELEHAAQVIYQAIKVLSDLTAKPGLINLDLADIETVMKDKGLARIGVGSAKGDNKAEAVRMAVHPLLSEMDIKEATDVIMNITGDITLADVSEATNFVHEQFGEMTNILYGASIETEMPDEATVTVIAMQG